MTSIVTDNTNNGNQYGDLIGEKLSNLKSRVSDNDFREINHNLLSFSFSYEKKLCFLLWIEFFVENNRSIDWRLSFDSASLCWSPDGLQEAVDQSRKDEESVNLQMTVDLFGKKSKLTQEQQELRDRFIALQEQWIDSEIPNLRFQSSTANDEAIARALAHGDLSDDDRRKVSSLQEDYDSDSSFESDGKYICAAPLSCSL